MLLGDKEGKREEEKGFQEKGQREEVGERMQRKGRGRKGSRQVTPSSGGESREKSFPFLVWKHVRYLCSWLPSVCAQLKVDR